MNDGRGGHLSFDVARGGRGGGGVKDTERGSVKKYRPLPAKE